MGVADRKLAKEIEEAQQARAALAEQDALRAKADELPDLLRQQEQARQQAEADAALAALEDDVKATLAEAAKKAAAFRQIFETLIADFEGLVAMLPEIENPVYAAGHDLLAALPDAAAFSNEWARLGGTNPDLATLPEVRPPGSASRALGDLLQRGARVVAYDPKRGARYFLRIM